ncbi:isopentenyl-diphosphate Delta-isomerase [Segniliparus rugosus]|uniref:Isopentenyl-diphosphate Delta-isomerase n=1 Tax=Segniliparus rugosus (strain ATCC BAA-974 / DSM 45345 / CCUG 50838 / CIP 108380 / JCM 13579 / CDC 945) TaxID=679197 RepID=E5XM63_SEGRC|nr:isopentenyl-diphosphate Delta-isomerase [Segniliparus rugosus]EFV14553.1 isopentenyl-diphosphate delta-isomerase [Segniliparus rugosus ATCC BAA-974]
MIIHNERRLPVAPKQPPLTADSEHVVLLDDALLPAGSAPKATVHDAETPLHLALSCYLFDQDRRLFVSQRARSKLTWPGVVTNSACGHPLPGEPLHHAARRVVRRELGCEIRELSTVLPHFSYRAVSSANIVEWEYCPVVVARVDSRELSPNPEEVEGGLWLRWDSFVELARQPEAMGLSPWCRLQMKELGEHQAPYERADRTNELPGYLQ